MPNKDAAFGLRPVRTLLGAPYNAQMSNPYFVPSSYGTALFVGDPIALHTEPTTNASALSTDFGEFPIGTLQTLIQASAGAFLLGAIVAFDILRTDLTKQYNPLSTERVVYVCDDPWMIYHMQEDSDGNSMPVTDSGLNANIVSASGGSTVTGISDYEIDSNTAATTASLNLRLLQLANIPDNAIGNQAVWEVMINQHDYRNTTGIGS